MPRTVLFACLLAALAIAPAAAQAQDSRNQIFRECQDGVLLGDYTSKEIRDARNNIPDDIDQYSNCRDVLSRALTSGTGGGGDAAGGGGAGGAGGGVGGGGASPLLTPSTDADRQALEDAATGGGDPVQLGDGSVVPGATGLAAGAARHDIPITLIVLLGLLALAAVAGAAPLVRRHALVPVAALRRVLPGGSR